MKKISLIVFLTVTSLLLLVITSWAEGWGHTNWGMSVAEVEKAINAKLIPSEKGVIYSHRLHRLFFIDQYKFQVSLNFSDNKLDKVHLLYLGKEGINDDSDGAYKFLLDELKKKYGTPLNGPKEEKCPFDGIQKSEEWVIKDMIIELQSCNVANDRPFYLTSVLYTSRQSASSEKL